MYLCIMCVILNMIMCDLFQVMKYLFVWCWCLVEMSYVCYYGGMFIMWDENGWCRKCFFLDIVVFFKKNLKKRPVFKTGPLACFNLKKFEKEKILINEEIRCFRGCWSNSPIAATWENCGKLLGDVWMKETRKRHLWLPENDLFFYAVENVKKDANGQKKEIQDHKKGKESWK